MWSFGFCISMNFTFRSFTVALSTLQIAYWKLFFWTFFYNYKHFYSNFFYNTRIGRRNHQKSKSKRHAWGWIWTGDPWIRRPVSYHWATEVVGFWSVQKALCTYLTYCKWPECEVQLYTVLLEKIYGAKCFWLVQLIYMHSLQGYSLANARSLTRLVVRACKLKALAWKILHCKFSPLVL